MSKIEKKTRRYSKKPLFSDTTFVNDLKNLFDDHTLISSASDLIKEFKEMNLPKKWTVNTTKKKLTQSKVLIYSRKKPAGYNLDVQKLNELSLYQNKLKESSKSSNGFGEVKSKKRIKEKNLNRIPPKSRFLLKRISPSARQILEMGILKINKLSVKELTKNIDHLSAARIFFDPQYSKEKDLLKYLNKKLRYMNKIKEKLHEEEANIKIKEIFQKSIGKKKFKKIIAKLGNEIDRNECAWQFIKKWGRKTKKIPISDYALQKRICEMLRDQFK